MHEERTFSVVGYIDKKAREEEAQSGKREVEEGEEKGSR